MLVYGMNLEKSRCTPDPVEFGKLVMNVAMTKYRMLDKYFGGQAVTVAVFVGFGCSWDSGCPLTLIKQETDVFYGQCMHIPALCGNAFVERLFEGAKSLLENQGSSERETILQSRCFWYQCYLHSVIPLLCTEEERLKLERIVDRGRIERKAAFDNLVDALDALELK
ncbi:hypothetical protein BCR33DRAFT_765371 [Rhizoclosmatium globosum]|uniref:Uncharacterized protein n=1 Tax=Rhizoclosmatium globosum TaxID=329046 RepID=A0A1Y2CER1_9FUNG|nr:hypothetical protein BCR33DRAFT_765371 [Rhizoclosmatium globosum]|eukprot:ORY45529.1 hypothetical protein BCR33DRAFT_765371 [Rhizoclosmatium globosum]